MLEGLRIKCPSCGIILEVRNSKHEAVKRIVCPNCKKQLALDFREEPLKDEKPKPLGALYFGEQRLELHEGINQIPLSGCQYIQINAVRLSDGSSKCTVSPLTADHPVKVNGLTLMSGDKVVLAIGDELLTGNTLLVFGKPGRTATPPPAPKPKRDELKKVPATRSNWLYGAIACVAVALAVIVFWPSAKVEPIVTGPDTPAIERPRPKEIITSCGPHKDNNDVKMVSKTPDYSKMSDYDLELMKDNAEAQYELGNRLIRRSGSSNVIRGINYLQEASQNGSSQARIIMNKAIYSLQQRAVNGDSIANYILMSIN